MPVYEFKDRCTGEVFEEVFATWRDAPRELTNENTGCVAERIVSTVQLAYVVDGERAKERALAKQGVVRYERGMENMARDARRRIEQGRAEARDRVIADTLAAF